jgi:hypothetical protein
VKKGKAPRPSASPEDFEQAAALVAASHFLSIGLRWSRKVQKELLPLIPAEEQGRIGYDKDFKKVIDDDNALKSFTIIWACTPPPEGPNDRALWLSGLKTKKGDKRPKLLTASVMGKRLREARKYKDILKPQNTTEKFISIERRHVRAGVKYGLLHCQDVPNSNCVAISATEQLHKLMVDFWKVDSALMYRLVSRALDNKPRKKKNRGDEEDTGGQ